MFVPDIEVEQEEKVIVSQKRKSVNYRKRMNEYE